MADIAWTAWLDEVMPSVAKAPRQVVQNAVRDAAIRLCAEGKVYLLESDAINIVANTKEYAWVKATVTNVAAHQIWQAIYNGYEMDLVGVADLKRLFNNWSIQTGPPSYALKLRPSVVRLVPYPIANLTAGLKLWAYVRPLRTATGIVDEIGEEYYQQIALGAKAKLLMSRGTPYYEPKLGAMFEQDFARAISVAGLKAAEGDSDTALEGEGEFF